MEEKQICALVKDLLPLYEEEALSDESMKAVREHLLNCESCNAEYDLEQNQKAFHEKIEPSIALSDEMAIDQKYNGLAKKIKKHRIRRTFEIIGAVLAVVIVINLMFDVNRVYDCSMQPTIKSEDSCLVSKVSYIVSEPDRGDIVKLHIKTKYEFCFMKRIVAIPGDKVVFKEGSLYVNGKKDKRYTNIKTYTSSKETLVLGKDEYFVIGDNVDNSMDSRYEEFGLVSKDDIVGKYVCKLPFRNPFVISSSVTSAESDQTGGQ